MIYAYVRFSHLDQAEGTSVKRQSDDCAAFALRRGWSIDQEFIDRGRSAFTGANRYKGAGLGRFEAEAVAGLHHGDTLIVERIDRLCREGYDETRALIRILNKGGVTIAIVDGDELYRPGDRLDITRILPLVIKAELAREESAKKSQRLTRKYEIRREEARATGRVLTANLPAWLRKAKDGRAEIVPGREVVIRRIFELADAGMGGDAIQRVLNAEYEPWTGKNGQVARIWTRSRVGRILRDRQVTGEYQPCLKDGTPAGEPWRDHLPRVVGQELFERVYAAASARQSPVNRHSTVVANLFGGLCRCASCGGVMTFERRRVAGHTYHRGRYVLKNDESRLRCSIAHADRDKDVKRCANRATVSYHGFEKALCDEALVYALDDRSFAASDELSRLNASLAEARRVHEIAVTKARAFWEAWARAQSATLETLARDTDRVAEDASAKVAELETAVARAGGQASAEEHLSRIAQVRELLRADDLEVRKLHRTKASQGFRTIIDRIEFDHHRGALVRFIAGKRVIKIVGGKVVANFGFDKGDDLGPAYSSSEKVAIKAYRSRQ